MAPRGSGKTAQRKMIEEWTKDKPVLSVTIDRFEFGSTQTIEDVSLPYHLKSIITNTLLSLIFGLAIILIQSIIYLKMINEIFQF